jgi:putative SOS response-associated peptidase YedK
LHSLSAIFPDAFVPVIRNTKNGHELTRMRWGIPSPAIHGGGLVFNVRNTKSGFWKPLLKAETRCLVPATSFCEYANNPDPKKKNKIPTWFALSEKRPLFFFAGVWKQWEGTRGTKAEPVKGKHLIYAFLTCEPNKVVKPVHAKAMPVMLTNKKEWDIWLRAPMDEALELQRPLPDKMLKIVASGEKKD